jgi:DNA-binding helix-hairpin-helix protein with protein kinase domain
LLIAVANSPWAKEERQRKSELESASNRLRTLEHEWQNIVGGDTTRHGSLRQTILAQIDQCRDLRKRYRQDFEALANDVEQLALHQHLRSCFIGDATIPSIGEGRKQMLAAYNVLTADDLTWRSIQTIRGFKAKLARSLMAWKDKMICEFRFDPSTGVPESDQRVLAARYRKLQRVLLGDIEQHLRELESVMPSALERLRGLIPDLRKAIAAHAKAEADYEVLTAARG